MFCFLSLAINPCRPFSRWALLAFRSLSLFLCLFFLALYSKFVNMTIYLSLILQTTRIEKQFPLSVFVFIDSFVVSALQDAGGYAISRQNNLELHLGYHWPLDWVILHWYACGADDGLSGGRSVYGHVKFSQMGRLLHFLTHGAPLARLAREDSAIIPHVLKIIKLPRKPSVCVSDKIWR